MEANRVYDPLHHIFLKSGVNAYLSGQGCTNYPHQGSVVYIGNPGPNDRELYSASVNGKKVFTQEMINGFLLHRVSSLEIATYFVTLAGEVVYKTQLQQRGKEFM